MCLTAGNKHTFDKNMKIVRCEIEAFSAVLYCEVASCPAVNNHWTGLLEWTTGLTFFVLKIIFMAYNEISCQYMHYIGF